MADVVAEADAMGVELRLEDGKVKASFPAHKECEMAPLLEQLRANRDELVEVLRERDIPDLPPGVKLISWKPKQPPVMLNRYSVVTDCALFAKATLRQLAAALAGKEWLAGNWSIAELVNRLREVGVVVEVQHTDSEIRKDGQDGKGRR
jgi:hypothetical protein